MHYFKRNIGDYHRKAGRLSMLEHGAYTLLMDACYDREEFPTKEQALEWCFARTDEEERAVEFVLKRFFTLNDDGVYVQGRIMDELLNYQENAQKNKEIAIEREKQKRLRKKGQKHEACTDRERTDHERAPNQEPLTTNQEPETNKPNKKPPRGNAAWFDSFWSTFDTRFGDKGSKKNAQAQWKKINPDQQLYDEIMAGLIAQIRQKEREQAAGAFCPNFKHVERWLKDRRWEDEISNRIVKPADTRDKAARAADEAFGPDSEPGFYEGDFARIEQDGPFE